jgi:hypothetical protein
MLNYLDYFKTDLKQNSYQKRKTQLVSLPFLLLYITVIYIKKCLEYFLLCRFRHIYLIVKLIIMKKIPLLLLLSFLLLSNTVFAQSCDPWIVSIYKSEYKRSPTSQECNIKNYNNGSWSSYQQLTELIKTYQNSIKPTTTSTNITTSVTGDPWITAIYKELYSRQPNSWEYNIKNYNNGSWGSYQQLKNYVDQFQKSLKNNGITIETAILNNDHNLVVFKKGGVNIGVNLLSNKGGNVVAAGGANVIAAGGGNVVAAGGANVVAAGGGNVVAGLMEF